MNEFHQEEEDFFCHFSFGQFVSLALLEVVALFFVFYLGARYGPALLGREPQAEPDRLVQLPEDGDAYPVGQVPGADVKYTFPETLTQKSEPQYAMRRVEPARQPVPVQPAPAEVRRPAPQPAAPPPAPAPAAVRGVYAIQVGSFRQSTGAAEKVNHWQSKGYDAYLSIGEVPQQGTVYRVRIGNFSSREKARQFLNDLVNRERVSAIIVRSNS